MAQTVAISVGSWILCARVSVLFKYELFVGTNVVIYYCKHHRKKYYAADHMSATRKLRETKIRVIENVVVSKTCNIMNEVY